MIYTVGPQVKLQKPARDAEKLLKAPLTNRSVLLLLLLLINIMIILMIIIIIMILMIMIKKLLKAPWTARPVFALFRTSSLRRSSRCEFRSAQVRAYDDRALC